MLYCLIISLCRFIMSLFMLIIDIQETRRNISFSTSSFITPIECDDVISAMTSLNSKVTLHSNVLFIVHVEHIPLYTYSIRVCSETVVTGSVSGRPHTPHVCLQHGHRVVSRSLRKHLKVLMVRNDAVMVLKNSGFNSTKLNVVWPRVPFHKPEPMQDL